MTQLEIEKLNSPSRNQLSAVAVRRMGKAGIDSLMVSESDKRALIVAQSVQQAAEKAGEEIALDIVTSEKDILKGAAVHCRAVIASGNDMPETHIALVHWSEVTNVVEAEDGKHVSSQAVTLAAPLELIARA